MTKEFSKSASSVNPQRRVLLINADCAFRFVGLIDKRAPGLLVSLVVNAQKMNCD